MLPKEQRLPIQLFAGKQGKLVRTPYFLFRIYPAGLAFSRFGVTISAKTAHKAVDRNRIKRLIYNSCAKLAEALPLADYWITVSGPATGLPKDRFVSELEKSFKR